MTGGGRSPFPLKTVNRYRVAPEFRYGSDAHGENPVRRREHVRDAFKRAVVAYRWYLDRCVPAVMRVGASPVAAVSQCNGTGSCIAIAPWSCPAEPPCPCRGSRNPRPVRMPVRAPFTAEEQGMWCRVECVRPVPRSISLFVDHRLRDGDNVVNSYCAISVNCSQNAPPAPKTVRYVRARNAETCGKSIFLCIMSACFRAVCVSAGRERWICRCAPQKDIRGHRMQQRHELRLITLPSIVRP